MYERGMDISSPSIDTYLAPYTGPNAMSDEDLINGTVYLSLVTKGVNNLTCDDQIKLEEVTLKWAKVSRNTLIQYPILFSHLLRIDLMTA